MKLILGDITKMETDAIVTPASTDLTETEGISKAIFDAVDRNALKKALKKIGHCPIGHAVITPSFGLKASYIIHSAGPGWYSGRANDRNVFRDCYQNAIYKAYSYGCRSVSIPLMFSGTLHIPRTEALKLVEEVVDRMERSLPSIEIYLVVYKKSIFDTATKVLKHAEIVDDIK